MLITDWNRRSLRQAVLAVLLGATAGLFFSGYWLIDVLPSNSRPLIAVTAAASAVFAVAYRFGLQKVSGLLRSAGPAKTLRVMLLAAPAAWFLFFAGTSQWQSSARYIGFWLPPQQFSLTSTDAQPGISITWINTSLGDVSYESLTSTGWIRRGDRMILQDPLRNSMEWRGQTGQTFEIVFESPDAGGDFRMRWNGVDEAIHVGPGKTSYAKAFAVPFFASREFILALGLLQFWALSAAAVLAASAVWGASDAGRMAMGRHANPSGRMLPELGTVAALMALAGLLRGFNLAGVFPAVDEYYHLIAADQLLQGAPLASVYPRGLWIVTLPVAFALRLFGHELWAARAMGVVFNVLGLVPLYILARKISKPAAVATGILYSCSPWIITFARVAREYAYYPLYFYLIVLAMVSLVEAIPLGFVARRDWRKLIRPKVALLLIALLAPPVFALRIDWLSTFRTILIAYLVLGAFMLARFDWSAKANWSVLGALALGLSAAGVYFYREQLTKLLLVPRVNPVPLSYFFPNPAQQWYYERVALVMAICIVIAVVAAVLLRRESIVPLFFAGLFLAYLTVFVLFSRTFFHTRHLISTQFWFVALAGIGVAWVWEWLRDRIPWSGAAAGGIAAAVIALLLLNPTQILLPTLSHDPDMPISEDYLHDMSEVQAYMLNHAGEGDALVSTVYGLYATWEGAPAFGKQMRINSGTTRDEIGSFMQGQADGWIVIDSIRLEMSSLSERSLTTLPQMEYIGDFGDEHVWRWGQPRAEIVPGSFRFTSWTSH